MPTDVKENAKGTVEEAEAEATTEESNDQEGSTGGQSTPKSPVFREGKF